MKSKRRSIYHASGTWYSSCTIGVCGPKELDLWRSRSRVWYAALPSLIAFVCPTVSLGANPIHRVLMPVGSNDHQVHHVNDQREIYTYLCERSRLCESHSMLSKSDWDNPKNSSQVKEIQQKKKRTETRSSLKTSLSSNTSCNVNAGSCSESTVNWGGPLECGM